MILFSPKEECMIMGNQTFTFNLMNCVLVLYWCTPVPPPSSSMAVKHGPCLLTPKKWSRLTHLLPGAQAQCLVRSKINFHVGPQEPLLVIIERRKFAWFGNVTRHDSPSKTILQGTLEGGRRRDRQRKCWMDNVKEWTSRPMSELLTVASCRKTPEENLCWIVCHVMRTTQSVKDWTDLNWNMYVLSKHVWIHSDKFWEMLLITRKWMRWNIDMFSIDYNLYVFAVDCFDVFWNAKTRFLFVISRRVFRRALIFLCWWLGFKYQESIS